MYSSTPKLIFSLNKFWGTRFQNRGVTKSKKKYKLISSKWLAMACQCWKNQDNTSLRYFHHLENTVWWQQHNLVVSQMMGSHYDGQPVRFLLIHLAPYRWRLLTYIFYTCWHRYWTGEQWVLNPMYLPYSCIPFSSQHICNGCYFLYFFVMSDCLSPSGAHGKFLPHFFVFQPAIRVVESFFSRLFCEGNIEA
jgi:hypothetical protein